MYIYTAMSEFREFRTLEDFGTQISIQRRTNYYKTKRNSKSIVTQRNRRKSWNPWSPINLEGEDWRQKQKFRGKMI